MTERYVINADFKNCKDCVFLERMDKIGETFCGRTRLNIKITKDCDTGPVDKKPVEIYTNRQ